MPSDRSDKAERLFALVNVLLAEPYGLSKAQIFDNIDGYFQVQSEAAREKLFDRDKQALRSLGIPLQTHGSEALFDEETKNQRYRIASQEYRLPDIDLTESEVRLLQVASSAWREMSLGESARSAMHKLGLSEQRDDTFEPRVSQPHGPVDFFYEALARQQVVTFSYSNASGTLSQRVLSPWGLGVRFSQWYCVGYDHDRRAVRIFRLSRVLSPHEVATAFVSAPTQFDLARSLDEIQESTRRHEVQVVLRAGKGHVLRARADTEVGDVLTFGYRSAEALGTLLLAHAGAILDIGSGPVKTWMRQAAVSIDEFARRPWSPLDPAQERSARRAAKASAESRLLRLLRLVPFLSRNPGLQIAEIAREFGVSTRQLRADLDTIFVSGPRYYSDQLVDLEIDDADQRVYIRDAQQFSAPLRLSPKEVSTILLGLDALDGLLNAQEQRSAKSLRAKIDALRPFHAQAPVSVDPQLADTEEQHTLAQLRSALEDSLQVRITYVTAARDERTERVIEPHSLYVRSGKWYVRAWCLRSEGERTFRLDRIDQLTLSDRKQSHGTPAQGSASAEERTTHPVWMRVLESSYFGQRFAEAKARAQLSGESEEWVMEIYDDAWLPELLAHFPGEIAVLGPESAQQAVTEWMGDYRRVLG